MTKKENKELKQQMREEFFELYSADILKHYNASINRFFLKITIDQVDYDYYPGSEWKDASGAIIEGYGRICKNVKGKVKWLNLSHQSFLKRIGIAIKKYDGDIFNDANIFNFDI